MRCHYCNKKFATRLCGKCKQVAYCNRECQKNGWKSHKKKCNPQIVNCGICMKEINLMKDRDVFKNKFCTHYFHLSCSLIKTKYIEDEKMCKVCNYANNLTDKLYLKSISLCLDIDYEFEENKISIHKLTNEIKLKVKRCIDLWKYLALYKNHNISQFNLSQYYIQEVYIKKDVNKSLSYLLLSSLNGYNKAQYVLASKFYHGDNIKINEYHYRKWLRIAALNNNSDAQYDCFKISKNENERIKWLKMACKTNNSDGKLDLGMIFVKNGNKSEGINLILSSAEQGNTNAMFWIGNAYTTGDYGMFKSKKKGILYFEMAAKLNHSMAIYNLGIAYSKGEGTEINEKLALSLFLKSANLNNDYAQFALYVTYNTGNLGVSKNNNIAFYWLKKAIDNNNEKAIEVWNEQLKKINLSKVR